MTYELAKKLKDAGFPRKKVGLMDVVFLNEERSMPIATPEEIEYFFNHRTDFVFIPKLSELIEACGEEFMLTNEGGVWEAWQGSESNVVRMGEAGAKHRCEGSSPEEAVANLWLAIKSA
jgi:hypothetical protein